MGGLNVATDSKLLDVTPLAREKLGEILSENGNQGSLLRVAATSGDHGGVRYSLGIEEVSAEGDLVIEAGDLRLIVDSADVPLIDGAKIDYVDGLMRSGFVISNPNLPEASQGGCGGGGGGCGCGGGGCSCGGGGCACGGH
jgi:iron-sulfur cluster assembly accessory protein